MVSSRFAKPIKGGSGNPGGEKRPLAELTCPSPPSTTTRSGNRGSLPEQSAISSFHHLFHRPEIIVSLKTSNLESPVTPWIRLSPNEPDHGGHHEGSRNMRDVEAFDHIRGTIQLKPLDKIGEIFPFALDRTGYPRVKRRVLAIVLDKEPERSLNFAARSKSILSARTFSFPP